MVVDGVNGAEGTILLNWKLGLAPEPKPGGLVKYKVRPGDPLTLIARIKEEPFAATYYQWLRNGVMIEGATNEVLILLSVGFEDAGSYSVMAGNDLGETNYTAADVIDMASKGYR